MLKYRGHELDLFTKITFDAIKNVGNFLYTYQHSTIQARKSLHTLFHIIAILGSIIR